MKSHEFSQPDKASELDATSWDTQEGQADEEPATPAEKHASRLGAKSLFEKGTINGNEVQDLSSDALGIHAHRMELGEGSSVTQVEHIGGPRAGASETRLAITGEDGESQEITFSHGQDGETKVTLDGKEVTDRETLAQIDAVTGHLAEQMDGGTRQESIGSAHVQHDEGIINRRGTLDRLKQGGGQYPGEQPKEATATWVSAESSPDEAAANLMAAQRQRRANVDASYEAWQHTEDSINAAELTQEDIDTTISGAGDLLRQSAAESLQEEVSEKIDEESTGRTDLEGIDTTAMADRIEERTIEASREHAEAGLSNEDLEEIIEAAAHSVEGEYIAEKSREERLEDARSDIASFFDGQSADGEASGGHDALKAAEYKVNQETSGAEKGAEDDAVQEIAEQSEAAQEQSSDKDAEQQKRQTFSRFNREFGAVMNSAVGNILRKSGVDPKQISERIQSGNLEVTPDMMAAITDLARNRQSSIWTENTRAESAVGRAAREQHAKVQELAEKLKG